MSRAHRGSRLVLAVAMASIAALLASCTPDLSQSTAPLLVPTDPTYRSQWNFEPVDGANNFAHYVHWDPSFNPDIDTSLTVVAYQVADQASWTGNPAADDARVAEVIRDHAVRELNDPEGACTKLAVEVPPVRSCAYDVGQAEDMLVVSRRFDTATGAVVVVVPTRYPDRAINYLAGDFEEVSASDVSDLVR